MDQVKVLEFRFVKHSSLNAHVSTEVEILHLGSF